MATEPHPYQLFCSPDSANVVVRMVLEELQVPYEAVHVDRSSNAHRTADFLRLNPQGLLPVLVDGEAVLFETAAIVLHLCERHHGLIPELGTRDRPQCYKWLFYLSNTLHADLRVAFYTHRHTLDASAIGGIRAATHRRLLEHFALVDAAVGKTRDGWLLDWGLSACDIYLAACARWAVIYPPGEALTGRQPVDFPHLRQLLERLEKRASVVSAYAQEGVSGCVFTRPVAPEGITRASFGT